MNRKKMNYEQRLLHVTVAMGILFSIIGVMMAAYTNFQVMLMDNTHGGAEAVVFASTVSLIPLLYRPYPERKPYSYFQLESLLLLMKGGFPATVTIGLITGNVRMIVNGGNHVDQGMISWSELLLAVLFAIMPIALLVTGRRADSPLIKAELLGWKINVCSSIGVVAVFPCAGLLADTSLARLSPYVGQVIVIVIAMIILSRPRRMTKDTFRDLILSAPGEDITQRIQRLVDREFGRYSYEPTFCNIIQTGRKFWVEIYIRNGINMINMAQLAVI